MKQKGGSKAFELFTLIHAQSFPYIKMNIVNVEIVSDDIKFQKNFVTPGLQVFHLKLSLVLLFIIKYIHY